MSVKLLTEYHLEFLSIKGSCTGSSESTLVKMPHWWKSHVVAQMLIHLPQTIPTLTLCSLVSSVDYLCKQFGQNAWPDLDPNCLTL